MKALYYDCFSGLSGDMNLGAMIDLGVDFMHLKMELSKLGLDHEFEITVKRADKHGIFGSKVDVIDLNEIHHGHHDHHDHHDHHEHHEHHEHHDHHEHNHDQLRDFKEIKNIIESSALSARVKRDSIKVFQIIAEAEAKIHGKSIDEVHFHEVGAIDSIVDIVGAAICYEALEVEAVYASTVEVGSGFVKCAHGLMPIPAPATAEILKGVPIKSDVMKFEMTTPTGAAILKAFVSLFTDSKEFTAQKIGYGLGMRDMEVPNLVRVFLIESNVLPQAVDKQWILETNIDDMSSELLVYAEEKLFEMGALDVYKTPIVMKKGRPAIKLTILAWEKDIKTIQRAVFTETTSIGMRMYPVEKVKIVRKYEICETSLGPISLKKAYFEDKLVNVKPEYEQIKKIAHETGQSIKDVYKRIEAEIQKG